MAAPMEKTRHPGIYKRGSRYVVVYKVDGVQHKESARTLDAARRLKAARTADRDRGELGEQSRVKFRAYAEEWVERYQGNGRRGFTETTREDYEASSNTMRTRSSTRGSAAHSPGSRHATSPSGSAGYASSRTIATAASSLTDRCGGS